MIQDKQKIFHPPQIERQTDFQNCLIWMEFHIKSYRHRMVGSASSPQETRRRKRNSFRRRGFTGTRNEKSGGSMPHRGKGRPWWGGSFHFRSYQHGGNGWTKRPELQEQKGYWKSSAVDWNGTRNAKRRSGLATVPDMSDCPTLPGCWTVQGRHWLPSSAQLNREILPKLSNANCSSNEGTGSRRASIRLLWDMVSLRSVSTGNRDQIWRTSRSRPIWISRWWLTSHIRQYGFWKSNPPQGCRQRFPRATPCRSAGRRHCSKPTGTIRFSTSFRRRGKCSATGRSLKSVENCLGVSLSDDASACDVQGWVLCLSMCDAKAFGPFLPEDTDVARCLDMASEFWENGELLLEKTG